MIFEKNSICIVGQGFVGLPLALSFSLKGYKVIGVDIDKNLVDELNSGITYHTEEYKGNSIRGILKKQLDTKKYIATNRISEAMKESNVIIVTVGIPIFNDEPIMDGLINAMKEIGRNLKRNDLVLIRSTVVPGTTEETLVPILEVESKLKVEKDFYIAYASERIAEGQAFDEFENMPTVVAGINEESFKRAEEVLKKICKADIIKASSIKVVETSKIFENIQRDVNIAMVQEFARFSENVGIDIFEIIKVANSHKRVNLLTPGPGVGGYCIPNAYYYLKPKAEELDLELKLLKTARRKNEQIPEFIVGKVNDILNSVGKGVKESSIAIIGIAMKDYSSDFRLSPAEKIIDLLIENGASVKAFDPEVKIKKEYIVNNLQDALYNCDLVLILARQKGIDFEEVKRSAISKEIFIMDTKNVYNNLTNNELKRYWKI